jgi:hypothetical protein
VGKTAIYVPSIDLLLSQEANKDDDAKRFLAGMWPIIRERLENYSA